VNKTIKINLENALRKVFDDDEFVMCITAHLTTNEIRRAFIKHIEENPEITSEEITLMSISAHRNEL